MNDEQKLRLRVASEQMAAMTVESIPTDALSTCVVICRKHEYRGDRLEDHMAFAAVKMADALIAEIERTAKAAPVKHPGWVFVDCEGDIWGYRSRDGRACSVNAERPFSTREDAAKQALITGWAIRKVRPWRPTDPVPPMPKGE